MNYTELLKRKTSVALKKESITADIHHQLKHFQRDCCEHLLSIGRGAAFLDCVSGDTLIETIDGPLPIADLASRGKPIVVKSRSQGGRVGWSMATCPFAKGSGEMYQIELSDGRTLKATGGHRVMTGGQWTSVSSLRYGHQLECEACHPLSIAGTCPSASEQDELHYSGRAEDSMDGYWSGLRRCGQQPHLLSGIAQSLSPLLAYALARDGMYLPSGDLEHKSLHTHRRQNIARLSMPDLGDRGRNVEDGILFRARSFGLRRFAGSIRALLQSPSVGSRVPSWRERLQCLFQQFWGDQFSPASFPCVSSVVSIRKLGTEVKYDMHVPGDECYLANGVWSHNTGLGKTILQLEWAKHIPGEVIIAAPLAVAHQTVREAQKLLDMSIAYSKDGTVSERVTITNYERLENFDLPRFTGVVLDESSIIKSKTSKTRQFLIDAFAGCRYRLACTATPSPNDYTELGNHAEFLGVMSQQEMLTRWFVHDSANTADWRLKGHAVKPFWNWVASWAACMSKPSDLGYSDDGYDLPPLRTHTHQVETQTRTAFDDGLLFDMPEMNATNLHRKKRESVDDRVSLVADMVNDDTDPWLVWCESNQESEMLTKAIPDAVEVKGSHDADTKEERLIGFVDGKYRVLVTKSSIAGFGLNLQHCRKQVFASISYSYEKFYQAVRRSWRFGQTQPVDIHVVVADAEIPVWRAIEKKALAHDQMKEHMKYAVFSKGQESQVKIDYNPTYQAKLPEWL